MSLFGFKNKELETADSKPIDGQGVSAPALLYTLEAEGRRWKDVDVCELVSALNFLTTSRSSGILLDAISPAVWTERREAFSQKGFSGVLVNAGSLPETISCDVISVMSSSSMTGHLRMEILDTIMPGGASQLASELSERLGFPISLEAHRTDDTVLDAYDRTSRLRHRIDLLFDAVLIVTGVCSAFAALAHYTAPAIMFVLAALMRTTMMKSVSSPFIAMPEGKLSASFLLSMFETENSPMEGRGEAVARYVWLLSRREPSIAIIMISFLGISLMLFLAAAPSVFQVLFSDGGTVTSLLFPPTEPSSSASAF